MDNTERYRQQVQLLLQVLPLVDKERCFALKGGTAINLFVRDFPRLSVDIDLVYLPIEERQTSLDNIQQALTRIAQDVERRLHGVTVTQAYEAKPDALRLVVQRGAVRIKVELSPVLRGSVYEPERRAVSERVEDEFGYAEMQVVSLADLYAGKICAALDRQHPRDLYDIHLLLQNEGLTEAIRKATLVYIISHPRPIAELLNPHRKNIGDVYRGEFAGMARDDVPQETLEAAREQLIRLLHCSISDAEKQFLLSFKNKAPDWALLGLDGIEALPAVRWKMKNLEQMRAPSHQQAYKTLEDVLHSLGRDEELE